VNLTKNIQNQVEFGEDFNLSRSGLPSTMPAVEETQITKYLSKVRPVYESSAHSLGFRFFLSSARNAINYYIGFNCSINMWVPPKRTWWMWSPHIAAWPTTCRGSVRISW